MKQFKKVELVAKNAPTGSYSAGCPAKNPAGYEDPICKNCERTF